MNEERGKSGDVLNQFVLSIHRLLRLGADLALVDEGLNRKLPYCTHGVIELLEFDRARLILIMRLSPLEKKRSLAYNTYIHASITYVSRLSLSHSMFFIPSSIQQPRCEAIPRKSTKSPTLPDPTLQTHQHPTHQIPVSPALWG